MLKDRSGKWVFLGRSRGFQSEIWLAAMGDSRQTRNPSLRDNIHCDRDACILSDDANRFPQVRAALVRRAEAFSDECRWADLVITTLPAPRWCREITQVIDRDVLTGSGTTTFRLKDGNPVVLDRAVARVTRPWQ